MPDTQSIAQERKQLLLVSLALAFVKAMEKPDPQVLAYLAEKNERQAKRSKEAKAHQKNVRTGKKK